MYGGLSTPVLTPYGNETHTVYSLSPYGNETHTVYSLSLPGNETHTVYSLSLPGNETHSSLLDELRGVLEVSGDVLSEPDLLLLRQNLSPERGHLWG